MRPDPVHAVMLACHPETPTDAVRGIAARVCRKREGSLAVTYVLEGDIDRLRVPAPRPPRSADRLWEHTCCELFIARRGLPAYHEINFSPSGEWAAYAFDGYRSPRAGETQSVELAPRVAVHVSPGQLELDAVIRLDRLAAPYLDAPLSLAISAVVEDGVGALSCWALRHASGKPDFHHSAAFALDLPKVDE